MDSKKLDKLYTIYLIAGSILIAIVLLVFLSFTGNPGESQNSADPGYGSNFNEMEKQILESREAEPVAAEKTAPEPVEEVETIEPIVEPAPQPEQAEQGMGTPEIQPPVSPEGETCSVSWHDSINRDFTQSREQFDATSLTAAHRSLPMGTVINISYQGKSIDVVVNDRTSQSFGRCLDITSGAFSQLAPLENQVIIVDIIVK